MQYGSILGADLNIMTICNRSEKDVSLLQSTVIHAAYCNPDSDVSNYAASLNVVQPQTKVP